MSQSINMSQSTSVSQDSPAPEIPWQVLDLIANILDPKTLATASCVSKSWSNVMSSNHLWEHICTTHFPSLTHLRSAAVPPLPYHRLYSLGATAAKRRQRQPSKPRITLQNLIFIITLNHPKSPPITITKRGSDLSLDHKPLFRFDFDVREHRNQVKRDKWLEFEVSDETIVTWNVALSTFDGVFTMMDCKGKGSFVSGSDGWFSAELPVSGCCCASGCGSGTSGMVAEMRLVMKEEDGEEGRRRMVVGSVNVGVLSVVSWRYINIEDGLRYSQHFLEPCNV